MPLRVKRILKWSGASFGALVLLIAATLFTAANTHLRLNQLADWLGDALSNEELQIQIDGLEGKLGSSLAIGNIAIADKRGVFAEARQISVKWRPWSLWKKRLHVQSLSIVELKLDRHPSIASDEEPSDLAIPAFGFRAESFAVSKMLVGSSLLGRPQQLTVGGAAELDPDAARASLDLKINSVGNDDESVRIELGYAAQPARFVADISIDEPTGGFIAFLAGLPAGERLSVSLKGTGPTDNWLGSLTIETGTATSVYSDVAVALKNETLNVGLDGTAKILPFVPAPLHPLLGPSLAFQADVALEKLDQLKFHRFAAKGETVTLEGQGEYGLADGSLNAKIAAALTVPENTVLPGFLVTESHLKANVSGSLEAPVLNLSFRSDALAFDAFRVRKLTGVAAVRPGDTGAYTVESSVRSESFDSGVPLVRGLLGQSFELDASGTLNRSLSGSSVSLTAKSGQLQAEIGSLLSSENRAITRALVSIGSISPSTRNIGFALDGKAQLEATLVTDLEDVTVSATISGAFAELTSSETAIVSVLGNRVPFSAAADWQFGSPIELIGLEVLTAAGRLVADGQVDLETNNLSANVDVAIPGFAKLSRVLGAPLDGMASVSASLSGSFERITARGQAQLQNAQVSGTAFGNIGVGYLTQVTSSDISTSLRLGGDLQGHPLVGSFDAMLRDQGVELSNIDISVGDNKVAGSVVLVPATNHIAGQLRITLNDIAGLPGAARSGLGGRAEIQIVSDRKRDLSVNARADALQFGKTSNRTLTIGNASAAFQVSSPLSEPTIKGQLTGKNITIAGLQRGAATVELDGTLSNIDWHARADMPAPQSGAFAASGRFSQAGDLVSLLVSELAGDVPGLKVALVAPFELTSRPPAWTISPVDLQIGDGRARFSGNFGAPNVNAALAIENLSISHATLFDPRIQLEGVLDGNLKMSGPADKPQIKSSISAKEVRPKELEKTEFAGFNADLSLRQTNEEANLVFKLAGPTSTRVAAEISTSPLVRLSANSETDFTAFPIKGALNASGRLNLIDRVVGLGEDRLDGSVETDAVLSGTVGNPVINGDLRLAGGAYEGAAVGTILRNITGHIAFTGNAARIVSLTMDDGDAGWLSGSGSLDFANVENPSGGFELTFENFTALRHQQAEMTTSGKLALTGSFKTPRLAGKLRVDKGEIRIPDALPESVVVLDVEEVNLGTITSQKTADPVEPAASAALAVGLGIDIEIPGQTFVRGRGLNSEWKGALAVSGTSRAPVIAGKLQAVRGTFAFAGKTFSIKNGEVFFPGGKVAEPEIDAVAETKLRDIVARVGIAGTVSKPSIGVSSDPPLPQEDVLSQILFGQTAGQLSPLQAAQLAQTAVTLSGAGGTGIVDKVRQALGADVLNFESGEDDARGASLKAGKYITEDVFLSVTQGTTPGSQKVGVEVQVLPNITVESNVSGEADSNIGVNWKWDY